MYIMHKSSLQVMHQAKELQDTHENRFVFLLIPTDFQSWALLHSVFIALNNFQDITDLSNIWVLEGLNFSNQ